MSARFGVLALQGDYAAHAAALSRAGAFAFEVRRPAELRDLDGLVLPGGESTTLLKLMGDAPWREAVRDFADAGGTLFGTCAGAILLAAEVRPAQASLGLLDVAVERNAWGRQAESFAAPLESEALGSFEGLFIRAPRIVRVGPGVEVLARLEGGEPVLVRRERVVAAAFHPELGGDLRVHRMVVGLAEGSRVSRPATLAPVLSPS